jgi:hypothetical protein
VHANAVCANSLVAEGSVPVSSESKFTHQKREEKNLKRIKKGEPSNGVRACGREKKQKKKNFQSMEGKKKKKKG